MFNHKPEEEEIMEPHQDRLARIVDEKNELDAKREKLGEFKNTAYYAILDWQEQERINTQGHLMTAYSAVLGERIAAFKKLFESTAIDAGAAQQ
jgi:hypothetical protein